MKSFHLLNFQSNQRNMLNSDSLQSLQFDSQPTLKLTRVLKFFKTNFRILSLYFNWFKLFLASILCPQTRQRYGALTICDSFHRSQSSESSKHIGHVWQTTAYRASHPAAEEWFWNKLLFWRCQLQQERTSRHKPDHGRSSSPDRPTPFRGLKSSQLRDSLPEKFLINGAARHTASPVAVIQTHTHSIRCRVNVDARLLFARTI